MLVADALHHCDVTGVVEFLERPRGWMPGEAVVERQGVFDGDAHCGASVADDAALVRDQRVHEVQPAAELHHHEHGVLV